MTTYTECKELHVDQWKELYLGYYWCPICYKKRKPTEPIKELFLV